MELGFAQQSAAFLRSIALGAALGALYGAAALLRIAFNAKKRAVIAMDIIYMLVCSLAVFYFSLSYLDGYIRIYVIFGTLAGFFVYRLTLGRLLFRLFKPIVATARRIIASILTKIKLIAKKLLKSGCEILYNVGGRIVLFMSANIFNNKKRIKYGKKRKRKKGSDTDRGAKARP